MAKPKPSEWGKLSHGQRYIPWSIDFARAVAGLGLERNIGVVFWHIIETSWSSAPRKPGEWSDPVPCTLSQAELGHIVGVERQNVHSALKWLVGARMVLKTEEGYWVNKEVEQWIHPVSEAPLVAGKRLSYAASARSRSLKVSPPPVPPETPIDECENEDKTRHAGTLQSVMPGHDTRNGACNDPTLQGVMSGHDGRHDGTLQASCPDMTEDTILERARLKSFKSIENQSSNDDRSTELKLVRSEDAEPFEAGETEPVKENEVTGPPGFAKTVALAAALFPDDNFAERIRHKGWDIHDKISGKFGSSTPQKLECYNAALEAMKQALEAPTSEGVGKPYPYALKTANKFALEGLPPDALKAKKRPKTKSEWDAPEASEYPDFRDFQKTYRPNRGAS